MIYEGRYTGPFLMSTPAGADRKLIVFICDRNIVVNSISVNGVSGTQRAMQQSVSSGFKVYAYEFELPTGTTAMITSNITPGSGGGSGQLFVYSLSGDHLASESTNTPSGVAASLTIAAGNGHVVAAAIGADQNELVLTGVTEDENYLIPDGVNEAVVGSEATSAGSRAVTADVGNSRQQFIALVALAYSVANVSSSRRRRAITIPGGQI